MRICALILYLRLRKNLLSHSTPSICFVSAGKKDFRDDIRKLKGLNQNILYDALKHNRIQDHVDLDDEDKELLSRMSKGILNI